jgi:pyruvate dehydrogenase E1 component beta subunit
LKKLGLCVLLRITYIVQERAFDFLDAPIQRITTADTPAPYSPLLKEWLPMLMT